MLSRKIIIVSSLLFASVIFLIKCMGGPVEGDPRGPAYAGAGTCGSCHKDIEETHLTSFHHNTSGKVSYDQLKKLAGEVRNAVYYKDSSTVSVSERNMQFFQSQTLHGTVLRSEPMDIAFGSAEKAQTYAYWKDEQLFQLPLTYFTLLHSWTNSPGYPVSTPYFDRVILSRCLECHGSYVSKSDFQTGPLQISEKLEKGSIIFGIDCERCHGPAMKHVTFHRQNPDVKEAKFITIIRSLTRQQQLDLCASCHSGNDLDVQQSLFGFKPGDTLANFYFPHFGSDSKEPDVHGKQMQLLRQSKCFQQSNMTCMSCHNGHQANDKNAEVFIAKCMNCHQNSSHALQMKMKDKSCINCHMPEEVSKALIFNNGNEIKRIPYLLRTHRIAVYPGQDSLQF